MSDEKNPTPLQAIVRFVEQPSRKSMLAGQLPRHMEINNFMERALFTIRKDPKLHNCTAISVFSSLATAAQLGLDVSGSLGQAYLIPFKDTATLVIGFKGWLSLIYNSTHVDSITVKPYFEGEEFDYQEGDSPSIKHKPDGRVEQSWGTMVGIYAVAFMKGGGKIRCHLYKKEIEALRKRSKTADNGPWQTDPLEMGKKAVILRLRKLLPASAEKAGKLEKAIQHEEAIETTGLPPVEFTDIQDAEVVQSKTEQLAEKVALSAFDKAREAVDNAHSELELAPALNLINALTDGPDKDALVNEYTKKKRNFAQKGK